MPSDPPTPFAVIIQPHLASGHNESTDGYRYNGWRGPGAVDRSTRSACPECGVSVLRWRDNDRGSAPDFGLEILIWFGLEVG